MFILKFCLGICLIFISTKIASLKAKNLKEKHLYFNSALIMCENLETELMYLKRPLKDALNIDYPSFYFAKTVKHVIDGEESFYPNFLTLDEIGKLDLLFSNLGKTDADSQIAYVSSSKMEFIKLSNEKREEYLKSYSTTLKIGFLIGLMLFILVI